MVSSYNCSRKLAFVYYRGTNQSPFPDKVIYPNWIYNPKIVKCQKVHYTINFVPLQNKYDSIFKCLFSILPNLAIVMSIFG